MKRRDFIRTTGFSAASLFLGDPLFAFSQGPRNQLLRKPDEVTAVVDGRSVQLVSRGNSDWTSRGLVVMVHDDADTLRVELQAPGLGLSQVTLHWKAEKSRPSRILNDHWERTYGDVSWHTPLVSEILPWYFMECHDEATNAYGVKTGAASFCYWKIRDRMLTLTMDTRCGGNGVTLGTRKLLAAEIMSATSLPGESPFDTGRRFMKLMSGTARMPAQPVYGINDWYFTYGKNSAALIQEHTALMAPMVEGLSNRPFSVIDAGWFRKSPALPDDCCWGDTMLESNDRFGDMEVLAKQIKQMGMRPAIWTRPLCGSSRDPRSLMLPSIAGRNEKRPVLDPSIPENLERIRDCLRLYHHWGYELVKFDFTTFDIFGRWGFEMVRDRSMTAPGWTMSDTSRTSAEIVLDLYRTIREAAGGMYVISCNTFSHLSAGLFELNRIGDDTSGNEWERTRKMGINTLAFRGMHHGAFYAADADCVGLTTRVAWKKNKQWLELLASSGTPLFISGQSEAIGRQQKEAIRRSFESAAHVLPLGEPLDWMDTMVPRRWRLNEEVLDFI
jgi:alpha-galactosidase